MKINKRSLFVFCLFLALLNYKFAKYSQSIILNIFPNFSYVLSIAIPWVALGLLLVTLFHIENGFNFDTKKIFTNKKELIAYSALIILGLVLFVFFGATKYFHSVKYPIMLILFTPIAEELIFRGFIYGVIEKISKYSPVIISAVFFGLHHLQYFNFSITGFAIFQVAYTFILGLLLGKLRKLSGNIYIGLLLHIIINYASVVF